MGIVFASIATSLDGYIATTNGDMAWLNHAMRPGEDYGFAEMLQRSGAYIIGANTYRAMIQLGMVGGDASNTYVVTHAPSIESAGKGITLYTGELRELVRSIQSKTDRDICLFGGGNLITQFIEQRLLDELTISIVPILLGQGIPLFGKFSARHHLLLAECKPYPSGIVIMRYHLNRA